MTSNSPENSNRPLESIHYLTVLVITGLYELEESMQKYVISLKSLMEPVLTINDFQTYLSPALYGSNI